VTATRGRSEGRENGPNTFATGGAYETSTARRRRTVLKRSPPRRITGLSTRIHPGGMGWRRATKENKRSAADRQAGRIRPRRFFLYEGRHGSHDPAPVGRGPAEGAGTHPTPTYPLPGEGPGATWRFTFYRQSEPSLYVDENGSTDGAARTGGPRLKANSRSGGGSSDKKRPTNYFEWPGRRRFVSYKPRPLKSQAEVAGPIWKRPIQTPKHGTGLPPGPSMKVEGNDGRRRDWEWPQRRPIEGGDPGPTRAIRGTPPANSTVKATVVQVPNSSEFPT